MSRFHRIVIIIILLLGAWVRFDALTAEVRFHPDEALFATFARDAAVHGAWMLPGALDKPPVSLYASALSMHFFGVHVNAKNVLDLDWRVGEIAARIPNTFAGIAAIALTYALGRLWFGRPSALTAALLTALSPYLVSYSATAFTDMLMLTLMLAALVMAARGRPAWSGVWLALAFATKQQAVFYLPLVVGVLALTLNPSPSGRGTLKASWLQAALAGLHIHLIPSERGILRTYLLPLRHEGEGGRGDEGRIFRFALAFFGGLMLLFLWDAARPEDSIFALAAVNNNPERLLIRLDELLPRLETWLRYAGTLFGPPWLTLLLVIIAFALPLQRFHTATLLNRRVNFLRRGLIYQAPTDPILPRERQTRRERCAMRFLAFYALAYFLLHWLTAFNTYDRYLLPIIPLMALLVGGTLDRRYAILNKKFLSVSSVPLWLKFTFVTTITVILLFSQTGFPSDDRARNHEIVALADFLNAQPLGAIIYDHWLGWEMNYYISAWSDKRRVYYPDARILAEDALKNPDPAPRWWIAPRTKASEFDVWLDALAEAGFTHTLEYESPMVVAYRLIPPWADHP